LLAAGTIVGTPAAAREKALREYSPEKYYECLMAVYEKAIKFGPGGKS